MYETRWFRRALALFVGAYYLVGCSTQEPGTILCEDTRAQPVEMECAYVGTKGLDIVVEQVEWTASESLDDAVMLMNLSPGDMVCGHYDLETGSANIFTDGPTLNVRYRIGFSGIDGAPQPVRSLKIWDAADCEDNYPQSVSLELIK